MRIDLAEVGRILTPVDEDSVKGARLLILTENAALLAREPLIAALAARQAGYDVHIAAAAAPAGIDMSLEKAGFCFHRAPFERARRPLLEKLHCLGALDQLIRRLKPDLLHCLGMQAVLYGGVLARLRRLSAVLAAPGLGPLGAMGSALPHLRLRMLGFALGGQKATVVVKSPEDRLGLIRARVLDGRRATFLLRGAAVDLARFLPVRRRMGAGETPVTILVPPEGQDEVGHCLLMQAQRMLKDRHVSARFVSAPDRHAGAEAMAEALARVDAVCLPGDPGEGVPQSLMEAAASGRAMIAPDLRGCREAVRPGVTGWLFPPGDAAGLAQALERVIADAGFRKVAGERAQELAQAEFSQEAFLTAALTVYRAGLSDAFAEAQNG